MDSVVVEENRPSVTAVGVEVDGAGAVRYFDVGAFTLRIGDEVMVPSERGSRLGLVVAGPYAIAPTESAPPLLRVIRRADAGDVERVERARVRQCDAARACARRVEERGLPMKIVSAELAADGGRMTVYFVAEGRIDFRDLVRELAQLLRARVEMKQIGPRDEAQHLGAVSLCGRELCCATWLRAPGNVSLKMAKAQGLALTPSRLAGVCGRLKCCLRFEYETYQDLRRGLPAVGSTVLSINGEGVVIRQNLLQQSIVLRRADGSEAEATLAQLLQKKSS